MTGNVVDELDIPSFPGLPATLLNTGNPTIFVEVVRVGLTGTETQAQMNGNAKLLEALGVIRTHCTVALGLAEAAEEATKRRPHTPKLCLVAGPQPYTSAAPKS